MVGGGLGVGVGVGGAGDGVRGLNDGLRGGSRCLVWDCLRRKRLVRGKMPCRWVARDFGKERAGVGVFAVFGGAVAVADLQRRRVCGYAWSLRSTETIRIRGSA